MLLANQLLLPVIVHINLLLVSLLPCALYMERVVHAVALCVCVCVWPKNVHLHTFRSNVFAKRPTYTAYSFTLYVARDLC